MRAPVVLLALLLLAPILLAGCGDAARGRSVADDRVLVADPQDDGIDALGSGRLALVGGCLGVDDFVVVWANGTRVVDGDPLTVELPDGTRAALGDEVRIGGGFVVEHSSARGVTDPIVVAGVEVPAACAAYDVFLASG